MYGKVTGHNFGKGSIEKLEIFENLLLYNHSME
jgi:hypothetical protein